MPLAESSSISRKTNVVDGPTDSEGSIGRPTDEQISSIHHMF